MDFFSPDRIEKLRALTDKGKPFVFDDGDMRTLHFDEHVVQSAMRLSAPDELVINYTQAMTGFLFFNPVPRHILIIGLGGGSLAKYCYRHLASAQITVLESNAEVIALREQFMIPADDGRFQVLHVDAALHLANRTPESTDVILLDGYDADGARPELCSCSFFNDCKRILRNHGVLVMNMADDGTTIAKMLVRTLPLFGGRHLWWFKTRVDNSHIAVVVKTDGSEAADTALRTTALQMGEQFSLELMHPKKAR